MIESANPGSPGGFESLAPPFILTRPIDWPYLKERCMSRIARALVALVILSGLALTGTAQPASAADVKVCVGSGTANIGGNGLVYPFVDPSARARSFGFNLSIIGGCAYSGIPTAPLTGLSAGGDLEGYCGHSTSLNGLAKANGVHGFIYVSAGSLLVIAPSPLTPTSFAVGVANAVPNVLNPAAGSCLGGGALTPGSNGATEFIVTGAVALVAVP